MPSTALFGPSSRPFGEVPGFESPAAPKDVQPAVDEATMLAQEKIRRTAAPPSTIGGMDADEQLRAQDWDDIAFRLTGFAHEYTRRRSWEMAEELAQEAIARAYEAGRKSSVYQPWDPAKQPLMDYLISRVISLASNEVRAKRNGCEVALDYEAWQVASNQANADEVLDKRGYAMRFCEVLRAELAGDELALRVLALMQADHITEGELAKELGVPIKEVKAARQRISRTAKRVTEQLSLV